MPVFKLSWNASKARSIRFVIMIKETCNKLVYAGNSDFIDILQALSNQVTEIDLISLQINNSSTSKMYDQLWHLFTFIRTCYKVVIYVVRFFIPEFDFP